MNQLAKSGAPAQDFAAAFQGGRWLAGLRGARSEEMRGVVAGKDPLCGDPTPVSLGTGYLRAASVHSNVAVNFGQDALEACIASALPTRLTMGALSRCQLSSQVKIVESNCLVVPHESIASQTDY
jgi:hypothetical protein